MSLEKIEGQNLPGAISHEKNMLQSWYLAQK